LPTSEDALRLALCTLHNIFVERKFKISAAKTKVTAFQGN
jgi:hypothetical protein